MSRATFRDASITHVDAPLKNASSGESQLLIGGTFQSLMVDPEINRALFFDL